MSTEPVIPVLGMEPRVTLAHGHHEMCPQMFMAAQSSVTQIPVEG
jgi:hypothetical protein